MPTTTPTCRCLTGSTAGRGPCEACGAIAEIHLAEEYEPSQLDFLDLFLEAYRPRPIPAAAPRAVCLPCAERPLARAA
jgi:hypothetical protein